MLFIVLAGIVFIGLGMMLRSGRNTITPPPTNQENTGAEVITPATIPSSSISFVNEITLAVTSPSSGAVVRSSSVVVRGKTSANAEIFVNDAETKADSNGNFSVNLTLEEGDNYILVAANDTYGNYAEKELTVTYSP